MIENHKNFTVGGSFYTSTNISTLLSCCSGQHLHISFNYGTSIHNMTKKLLRGFNQA